MQIRPPLMSWIISMQMHHSLRAVSLLAAAQSWTKQNFLDARRRVLCCATFCNTHNHAGGSLMGLQSP